MSERAWLWPSVALTSLSAATALLLIPNFAGLLPALLILPAWMAAAILIASVGFFASMAVRRVAKPAAETFRFLRAEKARIISTAFIVLLAGLNMIAFMWVKPLLNYLVPFRADPVLARLDNILFAGNDPSALVGWLNFPAAGLVYHQAWFIAMILALLMAAWAKPSSERSAALMSYFLLWSIAGPAIHVLLPAAGPIFFERMGYGDRFSSLDGGEETRFVADYLWSIYSSRSFGAGSGISAMPSMHVTIASWIVIVTHAFAKRWATLAGAAWLLIFSLSISLGWHYAVDGLVGAVAALICYRLLLTVYRKPGILALQPDPTHAAMKG